MKQIRKGRLLAVLGAGVAASVAVTMASAQPAPRVEKIEVTGTHIKRADAETSSVVQVITREQIERSGAARVTELLRELPAMGAGSVLDFDRGLGFNQANSTVSLRGLGSVATLVLLNGRRMTPSPVADPNTGQGTIFNLSSIPLSAVERIEILKDGASAIYGSDAVAGVINIILRKDYRGAEVSWSHWQKLDRFENQDYRSEQVTGTLGFGDLASDRYNVIATVEWFKRDPQKLNESGSGVRNEDLLRLAGRLAPLNSNLSFPANLRRETPAGSGVFPTAGRLAIDPRCPVENRVAVSATIEECRVTSFDYIYIRTEFERTGILARGTMQLTSRIAAFLEGGFSRNESRFPLRPPTLSAAAPSTWFNREGQRLSYTLALPPGHPDNPNSFTVGLLYQFSDLGIPEARVTQDVGRLVGGLNGTAGGWDWETAILHDRNDRTDTRNDRLHYPTLVQAVASGAYRFGSTSNSPALLASLHPELVTNGESRLTSWDLKGSRELFSWHAGPVALAAGIEVRREEMSVVSDPRLVAGEIIDTPSTGMDGRRTVWSVFGELSVPIARSLESQLALRTDHYSDFGYATTPKAGLKWNATPWLAARANWAKGFRAPSIFQISTAQIQGSFNNTQDPLRCPNGPGALPPGGEPEDCARRVSVLFSANRSIEPEESVSHTVGFILSPSRGYSLAVDRWYVHRTNFIDIFDFATVLRNEGNPSFAGGTIIRNPNPGSWLAGVPNSGPLQSVLLGFGNFGQQVVAGWDLEARAKWPMGAWGLLSLDANATYNDKYLWASRPGDPYVSTLGNLYIPGIADAGVPRFRGSVTATHDIASWSVLTRYNHVGGWYFGEPGLCYLPASNATLAYLGKCYVSAWQTWDVGATWSGMKNLKVSLLMRNITDKPAPYDPAFTTLGFNQAMHNPYGRYLQVSLNYKFR